MTKLFVEGKPTTMERQDPYTEKNIGQGNIVTVEREIKMKKIAYTVSIAILLWITLSTLEVVIHNGNEDYVYSKANLWGYIATESKSCHVTDCEKANGDAWLVTVKDRDGLLWCYYDDTPKAKWDTVYVRFKGDSIIDVSE